MNVAVKCVIVLLVIAPIIGLAMSLYTSDWHWLLLCLLIVFLMGG